MRPGGSIRPITARPVTDFPAPDSPTTPRTSPLAISKERPSIACSTSWRVTKSTRRLRTERTGSIILSKFRVESVAQPIAEQVDGEDQRRKGDAGEGHDPPLAGEQIIVADSDQGAERRHGVGHAGTQKRQG